MSLTASERSRRARIGALSLHAAGKTDTETARAALQRKFEDEVDPDRILTLEERARRADFAKRRHYERVTAKRLKTLKTKKSAAARPSAAPEEAGDGGAELQPEA